MNIHNRSAVVNILAHFFEKKSKINQKNRAFPPKKRIVFVSVRAIRPCLLHLGWVVGGGVRDNVKARPDFASFLCQILNCRISSAVRSSIILPTRHRPPKVFETPHHQ